MDLDRVAALGRQFVAELAPPGWTFGFDHAKMRAGRTSFDRSHISVSRHLMTLYDEPLVIDTILHEIAHARVGPGEGHGRRWKAEAKALGCSPNRLVDHDAPQLATPWEGVCAAGHRVGRHRRPTRVLLCVTCRHRSVMDQIFAWTHHGVLASPGPAYERELTLVLRHMGRA